MEIGHDVIDAQHRRLVEEVAAICREMNRDSIDDEVVKRHLVFLLNYAKEHFSTEEVLMLEMDYPDYQEHKEAHEWFIAETKKLVTDYARFGPSRALMSRMQHLLVDWLVSHIYGMDKKLGLYYRGLTKKGAKPR
jgi:hemerythrin